MRRIALIIAVLAGLAAAAAIAQLALIEIGREVIVLRTKTEDGDWLETRLWIVDDDDTSWLHGGDSEWMRNLTANPRVEIERAGETRHYRATPIRGPHPKIDELLRAKYGVADRWIRFIVPDTESVLPVRLDPLDQP